MYQIKPIAGTIGAEILGVDLTRPLSDSQFEEIHDAFLEHLVIFIPGDRPLSMDDLKRFAEYFGELDYDPFAYPFKIPKIEGYPEIYENIKEASNEGINIGGYWHADLTYRVKPHMASVLYAKDVPAFGGDTMFANQYLAYETLPKSLKEKLLNMEAVHSSAMPHGQSAARLPPSAVIMPRKRMTGSSRRPARRSPTLTRWRTSIRSFATIPRPAGGCCISIADLPRISWV